MYQNCQNVILIITQKVLRLLKLNFHDIFEFLGLFTIRCKICFYFLFLFFVFLLLLFFKFRAVPNFFDVNQWVIYEPNVV